MSRHLLHVGYAKAGSTYLQRWFEAHPELAYVEGGIAGFRDVWTIAREGAIGAAPPRYRVTSAEVLSAPRVDIDLSFSAESEWVSDIVFAQERVADLLAGILPGAVVLIVTRGYRSMILSSNSQLVRVGGQRDLAQLVEEFRNPELRGRAPWQYDRLIHVYGDRFGPENLVVMPWELLRDDRRAFIEHLAQRLGIAAFALDAGRVNPSLSPAEMYWYPRFARIASATRSRRLQRLLVQLSFHNRLRGLIRVLEKVRPEARISESLIEDEVIEPFRGTAESLRSNPLYEPYRREYLLD